MIILISDKELRKAGNKKMINKVIENKKFYSVIGFKQKDMRASFYKDGYIRKGYAQRIALKLIREGYEKVIIRLEEVFFRDEYHDYSCSSVIEKFTN